jgi:hypothetical protein
MQNAAHRSRAAQPGSAKANKQAAFSEVVAGCAGIFTAVNVHGFSAPTASRIAGVVLAKHLAAIAADADALTARMRDMELVFGQLPPEVQQQLHARAREQREREQREREQREQQEQRERDELARRAAETAAAADALDARGAQMAREYAAREAGDARRGAKRSKPDAAPADAAGAAGTPAE